MPAVAETKPRPTVGFIFLLGGLSGLSAISIDLTLPAMPQVTAALSTTPALAQLTFSLFLLGAGVGQLLFGPLADRIGRKPALLAGLCLFLLGSLLCALSSSIAVLIAARLLQGLGASVSRSVVPAIVRDVTSGSETARLLSYIGMITAVAPLLGPVVGGGLLLLGSWRTVFALMGLCALVLAVSALLGFKETLVARPAGTHTPLKAGLRRFFTDRRCIVPALIGAVAYAGVFGYVSGSSLVLINVLGVSPQIFGFYFAMSAVSLMGGARLNASLVRRLGLYSALAIGVRLMLAGGLLLVVCGFLHLKGSAGALAVVMPMMLYTMGLAFAASNGMALALQPAADMAGLASALLGSLQTVAGALAAWLVGAMFNGSSWSLIQVVAGAAVITFTLHTLFLAGRSTD